MKKKIKIVVISLLILFLAGRVSIFIVLNKFVRDYKASLIDMLSHKLGREITVREVKVSFLGGIYLFDLEVRTLGEEYPLERFRAARLVTHLNFFNLIRGKKDYQQAFRKISFQGGNMKLRSLAKPVKNIKGKIVVTNHDFYVDRLIFPLGETKVILKGWLRNFVAGPTIDLDVETDNFGIKDLAGFWPRLEPLKLSGRGRISGRLTGEPGKIKVLGEIVLNNVGSKNFQFPQIKSNFYFGDGFINFSPAQAKILKGQIAGKIKVTEIFSKPNLVSQMKIKGIKLPFAECFGEINFSGPLFEPRVLGNLIFVQGEEKISLEKISCQLGRVDQNLFCKNGEIFVAELGKLVWQAEVKDDLTYGFHFCLPPLGSKNLSFYLKKWPDFPGVFKAEGRVTGLIGSPEVNYQGNLVWERFGKKNIIKWKIKKDADSVRIENVSLGEKAYLTGSLSSHPYLLRLQLFLKDLPLADNSSSRLNGQINLRGDKERLVLEESVLSSGKLICRLKGEKKADILKLKANLEGKKVSSQAQLNLTGEMLPAGFTGKILVEPVVIQGKEYLPMRGLLKIGSKKIIIEKMRWLEAYFLEGEIGFNPQVINLSLTLENADIVPLLGFSPSFSAEDNFGRASGKIECKGKWPEIAVQGIVELKDSKIGKKNIEYAKFQIEGINPCFILKESPVVMDGTRLICRGPIDFSGKGKQMFRDIEYLLDESQMVWKGWEIDQKEEKDELSLTKEVSGGFAVSLRTPTVGKPEEDLAEEPGPEMELEYRIKGKEKFKLRIEEDEDFVGLEHEVKF